MFRKVLRKQETKMEFSQGQRVRVVTVLPHPFESRPRDVVSLRRYVRQVGIIDLCLPRTTSYGFNKFRVAFEHGYLVEFYAAELEDADAIFQKRSRPYA